jgi:hypothetical protein
MEERKEMPKKITFIASCVVLVLFSGCVSQEKYRKLEIEHSNTQQQMREDKKALFALQVQNMKMFQDMELMKENQRLKKTIDELKLQLNSEKSYDVQSRKIISKTAPTTDELSRPYSILLSSCQLQESVQQVLLNYKKTDLKPFVVKVNLGEKGVWWRIFSGHFETRLMAINAKNNRGLADKIVLKTNQADSIWAQDKKNEPVNNNTAIAHDEENKAGENSTVLAQIKKTDP